MRWTCTEMGGVALYDAAQALSRFVRRHPELDVQLQLSVDPPPLTDDAFDVCVRFGPPPHARVIARLAAPNRRLLCAAPAYLATRGVARDLTARRQRALTGRRKSCYARCNPNERVPRADPIRAPAVRCQRVEP